MLSGLTTLGEAAISAFSMLGGAMALGTGFSATAAYARGRRSQQLADAVNFGIVLGFVLGVPLALPTFVAGLGTVS